MMAHFRCIHLRFQKTDTQNGTPLVNHGTYRGLSSIIRFLLLRGFECHQLQISNLLSLEMTAENVDARNEQNVQDLSTTICLEGLRKAAKFWQFMFWVHTSFEHDFGKIKIVNCLMDGFEAFGSLIAMDHG